MEVFGSGSTVDRDNDNGGVKVDDDYNNDDDDADDDDVKHDLQTLHLLSNVQQFLKCWDHR